jgi:peptide/nickel transport system permease protein
MSFFSSGTTGDSLAQLTWRRLRRNKMAMAGLIFIALACLVAVLGYLITPDQTPYANEQKPELHILRPGSTVQFLKVRNNAPSTPSNFFSTMLFGKNSDHSTYAYSDLVFSGPHILITEYHEGGGTGDRLVFDLADVVYDLKPGTTPVYDSLKATLTFYESGSTVASTIPVQTLREHVKKEHLSARRFALGTDLLGRDILSRLIIGTRISLGVGLISVLISISIGISLGAIAGYFRGATDAVIMWLINVVWSIPTLLLVIAITFVLGKGVTQVFIAVGLTMWVDVARIVRGQVLGLREKEFIEAGKALGFSNARVIFRHILPNVMGPVVVMAASNFASAILMEAGLSFLGIGAQPPVPSWGEMINAHRGYILMDKAYLAFIPGAAIMLLVLAFMLVGNGLRDALDTRSVDTRALAG